MHRHHSTSRYHSDINLDRYRDASPVLPFTNMSSDPEQEYFSDGVSEEIITDLSKMSGLFVIARNTAFIYKYKVSNVPGVRFALEGSVRKARERVRITAQLIDGVNGGHLWAERYDRDLTDIFEVQDDVTQNSDLAAVSEKWIAGQPCTTVTSVCTLNHKQIEDTQMNRILGGIIVATLAGPGFAGEMGTPEEAKAMSEEAKAAVNEMGREKAFAAFSDPNGDFQEKDLYVFCVDMDGVLISQPLKPELVGKNLFNFDKYGDLLFQDMINVAQASSSGWVDYKWPYPGTDEIKPKTSYIATNDEGFFCGVGAYK